MLVLEDDRTGNFPIKTVNLTGPKKGMSGWWVDELATSRVKEIGPKEECPEFFV
jgi:hypothetical protein